MLKRLQKTTFFILIITLASTAQATTYYVKSNATGNGSGTSWDNAFTTIEAALTSAIVGDEVWVAAGVYKPLSVAFTIPNGVKVYGSFAGTETAVSQRNITANTTTLNGDIGTVGVATDNSPNLILLNNSSNLTRFDGFRLINCYNNASGIEDGGSAMRLNNSSAVIENCIFLINHSKIRGGAVNVRNGGNPSFINCIFSNNTTDNYTNSAGGALFINSGNVKIFGCKFTDNNTQGLGGAIAGFGGTITMDRCTISGNTATDGAGGIYIGDNATFNIYNTLIVGNIANATAGVAIYMSTTFNVNSHNIINCTVAGNKANTPNASTTVHANNSTTIKNCIFWGNDSNHEVYCVPPTIVPNLDYCIIEGTYPDTAANGVLSSNPLFISAGAASNAPFNHETFNYNLATGSPAANAGNNSSVNSTYNFDLTGLQRISNGTVDLGAYESDAMSTGDFAGNQNSLYYDYMNSEMYFANADTVQNSTLTIFDVNGKEVYKTSVTGQSVKIKIDVPGLYFAKLNNSKGIKILVK